MLIAFTGAQGTGKTTLLNMLEQNPKITNRFEFVKGITRALASKGLKINKDGDDETQLAMINAHHENTKLDDAILDRCVLDVFCYTEYLYNNEKISEETFNKVKEIFLNDIKAYDVIFYLAPEFDPIDDGVRSADKEYRDAIADLFDKNIIKYDIDVITLTGDPERRMQTIYSTLKEQGVEV